VVKLAPNPRNPSEPGANQALAAMIEALPQPFKSLAERERLQAEISDWRSEAVHLSAFSFPDSRLCSVSCRLLFVGDELIQVRGPFPFGPQSDGAIEHLLVAVGAHARLHLRMSTSKWLIIAL
jgi:hypothetical protein